MKKFVFAMIALGGYNLFIFCKNNKIPLPVDLLTTTPTLLLYGISASITALTIAATSCFSLLITTLLQDNEIYIKCFRKRKSTESNKETIKNALFNYLLLLLPTITILAIYFTYFDEIKTIIPPAKLFYIYVAEVLLTSLIIGIYVSKKFNHISNSDRFKIYSSIFLIKIIWIYTLSFSAFWVKNIFSAPESMIIPLTLAIIVLNCVFIIPAKGKSSFQNTEQQHHKKTISDKILTETYEPSLLLTLIIIAIITIHPDIVKKTSATSLKIFGIGGDIERNYKVNKREQYDYLIEKNHIENDKTIIKIKVILDIGNYFFIRDKAGNIHELDRKDFSLILYP